MSQCWPEGALRAHLDRELAPEELDHVASHLGECPECARLSAELAARAERVGAFLETLPAPAMEWVAPAPRPAAATWRWIGVAAALAAGVALGVLSLLPRHQDVVAVPAPRVASARPASEPPATVAPTVQTVAPPRRPRRPSPRARTVSNEFLALDDEPFDTGVVMRVGVEPGNVQADVVFGPDGRAHAIRLVGQASRPVHP
jgi:hypothetical protein